MDRYFPSYVSSYSDGASEGSGAQESYSSGGSSPSAEFPMSYSPFGFPLTPGNTSPSRKRSDEPVDVFFDCRFPRFWPNPYKASKHGYKSNVMCCDEPRRRNSISSWPSPQPLSYWMQPFMHVGPWQLWGRANDVGDHDNDSNHQSSSRFQLQQPGAHQDFDKGNPFENYTSFPPMSQSRTRARPRLSTCDDPKSDLMKNGRDVVMDDMDRLLIRLREPAYQRPQFPNADRTESYQEWQKEPPLKYRLAQVRAMIRQELEERARQNEARGFWGPPKKDRNAKKCKFCLKKKERDEIVTHHNVKDDRGRVTCPILREYRCDVCKGKGHTIKYCVHNNPDTPHDVILQARLQVFLRNKKGE